MTVREVCDFMEKYAKCPKCGCETVGNGTGTFEVDSKEGYIKRTCPCGWRIEIKESDLKV